MKKNKKKWYEYILFLAQLGETGQKIAHSTWTLLVFGLSIWVTCSQNQLAQTTKHDTKTTIEKNKAIHEKDSCQRKADSCSTELINHKY